jgi:uncharacterized coiled-coil protein SlyX
MSEYTSPAFLLASADLIAIVATTTFLNNKIAEQAQQIDRLKTEVSRLETYVTAKCSSEKLRIVEERLAEMEAERYRCPSRDRWGDPSTRYSRDRFDPPAWDHRGPREGRRTAETNDEFDPVAAVVEQALSGRQT